MSVAAKTQHQPQDHALRADGAQRRVLYAEDSTSSRIVTTAMLKRMGYLVDAVEDGELALQLARTNTYDLILLDIEMPIMDGVTAARHIRALGHHVADTPILALSAFLADSTELSVWRDAFDSALPKPANGNELMRAMSKALQARCPKAAIELPATAKVELVQPGSVFDGLRTVLPKGAWLRLMDTAAVEMRHAIIVIGACAEVGDGETIRQTAHGLSGLALNFDNARLHEHARMILTTQDAVISAALIEQMFDVVDAWLLDCQNRPA